MSRDPNHPDYVPDKRLSKLFDAIEQQDEEIVEELCPSFTELANEEERYVDETLLGKGGLKEVYKAFDRRTHQWVALARLRQDRGLQYYDLFIREAWLISSLHHPNIIKVYDAGADGEGRPFFTMDLKGSTSLADLIRDQSANTLDDLLEVFLKICDAMAYAHSQGVIHLDLKPENIQCDRFGEVLVCDWGLGRALGDRDSAHEIDLLPRSKIEHETLLGQVQGTLGYMAPEQAVCGWDKDERTDIFALGCILYTILCGEPPFAGSIDTVMEKTATSGIPPLRSRYPNRRIPKSLEAVVLKATARNPEDRYVSAVNLRLEIHKYLTGYATKAEQPGFIKEATLFVARNRIPVAITMAALVVLTVLSVLFVQRLGREQLATAEERQRANQLMTEVDLISLDYQQLSEESAVSRKELAVELSQAAHNLKQMSILHRPVDTVQQAQQLVTMALHLDPECRGAHWNRSVLNCITLNYESALDGAKQADLSFQSGHMMMAAAFPHYDFNENKRPTTEQLVTLFRVAQQSALQDSDKMANYLERVFAYHSMAVKDRSRLGEALETLLVVLNGGAGRLAMEYDPESLSLLVESDLETLRFRVRVGRATNCLLRFIPVRSLKIKSDSELDVREVDRLTVETLDLSESPNAMISKHVVLPQLKTLRIKRGQFASIHLQKRIRTNVPFDIIEID